MAFPYSEGSDYAESLLSAKLLFMESVFSWYAVYTAARAEKKVKERLDQIGIENYLPVTPPLHFWPDFSAYLHPVHVPPIHNIQAAAMESRQDLPQNVDPSLAHIQQNLRCLRWNNFQNL